ncbi:hypothetical protein BH18ACI4_BH18ACI4_18220 [soil metagenome]
MAFSEFTNVDRFGSHSYILAWQAAEKLRTINESHERTSKKGLSSSHFVYFVDRLVLLIVAHAFFRSLLGFLSLRLCVNP